MKSVLNEIIHFFQVLNTKIKKNNDNENYYFNNYFNKIINIIFKKNLI